MKIDSKHCDATGVVTIDAYEALKWASSEIIKENENLKAQFKKLDKEFAPQVAKIDRLERKLKYVVEFLNSIDQPLCELIIDDCGFDPTKESRQDLINVVKTNSDKCDEILFNLRTAIKNLEIIR